jgi:hypothetical protein
VPVVTFGHGWRHLRPDGLSQERVETEIIADLERNALREQRRLEVRRILVEGNEIEYRAWQDGDRLNVGTYFPIGGSE